MDFIGIFIKIEGFNQKMHLVVEIFSKTLKLLAFGPTRELFKIVVQQQGEIYEREFLDPDSLVRELHSTVFGSHHHPLWEKYKRLRSISFWDFQQFCRSFCEQVEIVTFVHGNIDKDQSRKIMQNFLNDFQCKRIKNVSIYLFYTL